MSGPHISFENRAVRTAKAFGVNPEFDMHVDPSNGRTSFKPPVKFPELNAEAKSIHPEPFNIEDYLAKMPEAPDEIPF